MNNSIQTKNVPFWVSVSVLGVLFSVISLLIYRNMRELLSGVRVDVRIEEVEKSNNTNLFSLKGNAKHATFISVNGREIFIQKNGDFDEKIVIPDGYYVITLFARNKFGKDDEKTIEIYNQKDKIMVYEKKV